MYSDCVYYTLPLNYLLRRSSFANVVTDYVSRAVNLLRGSLSLAVLLTSSAGKFVDTDCRPLSIYLALNDQLFSSVQSSDVAQQLPILPLTVEILYDSIRIHKLCINNSLT